MTRGEKIKSLRKAMKISQVELAKKIGVSKQTLYKYENDIITNVPSDKIELLSNVLQTTPAYLMGWDNDSGITKMSKVSEAIKIANLRGISLSELLGFDIIPEDYGDPTKTRIHEARYKSNIRTGKTTGHKNFDLQLFGGGFTLRPDESQLLNNYNLLNETGKEKAQDSVHDLTEIKRYRKDNKVTSFPVLNAAHERTDIDVTDEMLQHDDDIMDNDDEW